MVLVCCFAHETIKVGRLVLVRAVHIILIAISPFSCFIVFFCYLWQYFCLVSFHGTSSSRIQCIRTKILDTVTCKTRCSLLGRTDSNGDPCKWFQCLPVIKFLNKLTEHLHKTVTYHRVGLSAAYWFIFYLDKAYISPNLTRLHSFKITHDTSPQWALDSTLNTCMMCCATTLLFFYINFSVFMHYL